jgi:hypothetical protein
MRYTSLILAFIVLFVHVGSDTFFEAQEAFAGPAWQVEDDFDDGVLDPTLWDTPYGHVWEADGVCYFQWRGYLNFKGLYDPEIFDIVIEVDVMFGNAADIFDIVTRSDGVSNPGFYGEVMNGLKFSLKPSDILVPDNGVKIDFFKEGAVERAPNQTTFVDLPNMLPVYHMVAVDSAGIYRVMVNDILVTEASGPLPEMGNSFSFYNRERSYVLRIDNLKITAYAKAEQICDAFLSPSQVAIVDPGRFRRGPTIGSHRNQNRHSFKIHLKPCEPLAVFVGDSAEVYVDVDESDAFESDERYPAAISSVDESGAATDIAVKVFVGDDLRDNNPRVAILSLTGTGIVDSAGHLIDYLRLNTFTPGFIADAGNVQGRIDQLSNFPNPFNPLTVISYTLKTGGQVRLEVFDVHTL